MGSGGPLVSVVAVCYNQARFAVECLESIRCQTYPNLQLILVDDASSDGSASVIQDWLDRTDTVATFVRHTENQGVCRSRNDAFAHVEGDYVAATSVDDVWLPEHLARAVDLIQRLPRTTGVVYADAYCIEEDGRRLPQMFIESFGTFDAMPEGLIFEDLLQANFIPAMTVLGRRECYEAAGPFDETLVYEDWDMWLRLAKRYEFAFSPHVGASYRVVSGSLSTRHEQLWESAMRVQLKHIGYSPEWDAVLWRRIARIAYKIDHPQQREYLEMSLRHDGCRHSAFLCGLTACRVPYRWIAPAWNAGRNLRERLRVARGRPRTI